MSYKFGRQSLTARSHLHKDLQRLVDEMIKEIDFRILDARRGKKAQEIAFLKGNSKAHFGQSAHNYDPAIACDLFPAPYDWDDLKSFLRLGEVGEHCATQLGIPIQWGGRWKMRDYPHFELKPWRTWAKQSKLYLG